MTLVGLLGVPRPATQRGSLGMALDATLCREALKTLRKSLLGMALEEALERSRERMVSDGLERGDVHHELLSLVAEAILHEEGGEWVEDILEAAYKAFSMTPAACSSIASGKAEAMRSRKGSPRRPRRSPYAKAASSAKTPSSTRFDEIKSVEADGDGGGDALTTSTKSATLVASSFTVAVTTFTTPAWTPNACIPLLPPALTSQSR
jgi:hypothetical protein